MNQRLQILIVEDDNIASADIERALLQAGFGVSGIAHTYDEAVSLVKRKPVNLSVIDVHLGDSTRDGVATAEALLRQQWMPLIYLTGKTDEETFERAKATDPFAFLNKPLRPSELVNQIKLALHHFQQGSHFASTDVTQSLYWPTELGYARVMPPDIYFLEGDRNYTKAYLTLEGAQRTMPKATQKQPLVLTGNLGYWGKDLPAQVFCRLSRSLIINLTYIDRIETHQIILGPYSIPLSDGTRKTLMNRLRIIGTR